MPAQQHDKLQKADESRKRLYQPYRIAILLLANKISDEQLLPTSILPCTPKEKSESFANRAGVRKIQDQSPGKVPGFSRLCAKSDAMFPRKADELIHPKNDPRGSPGRTEDSSRSSV